MIPQLDDEDWACAFQYAGEKAEYSYEQFAKPKVTSVIGDTAQPDPFSREDVAEVLWLYEGEHDGDDWLCVGRLHDGRFFFLSAWCDYTGWD